MFLLCHRFWLHVPLGIINGILFFINPTFAVSLLLAFLVYEIYQCIKIDDEAHHDIIGHLGGLSIVAVGVVVIYIGGLL